MTDFHLELPIELEDSQPQNSDGEIFLKLVFTNFGVIIKCLMDICQLTHQQILNYFYLVLQEGMQNIFIPEQYIQLSIGNFTHTYISLYLHKFSPKM